MARLARIVVPGCAQVMPDRDLFPVRAVYRKGEAATMDLSVADRAELARMQASAPKRTS